MALRFPRHLRCVAKSSLRPSTENEKTFWSSEAVAKGERRTAVRLDQLRTRHGAKPYTVSIATAIRTKSNWQRLTCYELLISRRSLANAGGKIGRVIGGFCFFCYSPTAT